MRDKIEKTWNRLDRLINTVTTVSPVLVKESLNNFYNNLDLEMKRASKKRPLKNGMADYWPVY